MLHLDGAGGTRRRGSIPYASNHATSINLYGTNIQKSSLRGPLELATSISNFAWLTGVHLSLPTNIKSRALHCLNFRSA